MLFQSLKTFAADRRQKSFNQKLEHEIFERLMPHVRQEKDHGYPFMTNEEMNTVTQDFEVQALLDTVEQHIANMPTGYGKKFRYIMHRDLGPRLKMYERLARKRVRRECDPRFVATHA